MAFALAALQATRLDLVRAVHGHRSGSGRPTASRHAPVAVQVTGTMLLLVCAAVFLRAAMRSATVDPGIDTSDVLSVEVGAEWTRSAVLAGLRNDASVRAIVAGAIADLGGRPALVDAGRGPSPVTCQLVASTYVEALDVRLLRGRGSRRWSAMPARQWRNDVHCVCALARRRSVGSSASRHVRTTRRRPDTPTRRRQCRPQ